PLGRQPLPRSPRRLLPRQAPSGRRRGDRPSRAGRWSRPPRRTSPPTPRTAPTHHVSYPRQSLYALACARAAPGPRCGAFPPPLSSLRSRRCVSPDTTPRRRVRMRPPSARAAPGPRCGAFPPPLWSLRSRRCVSPDTTARRRVCMRPPALARRRALGAGESGGDDLGDSEAAGKYGVGNPVEVGIELVQDGDELVDLFGQGRLGEGTHIFL